MDKVLKGKLIKWNSEKGFGFIQDDDSPKSIFVHISDFTQKGFCPHVGETIFYKIGKGKDGRQKAINAYSNRKKLNHTGISSGKNYNKKNVFNLKFISFLLVIVFIMIIKSLELSPIKNITTNVENYKKQTFDDEQYGDDDTDEFLKNINAFMEKHGTRSEYFDTINDDSDKEFIDKLNVELNKKTKDNSLRQHMFSCDDRTYCSQMRSCEEATYFLNHCPNTKMDGDRDGIPCESQWCNSYL